MTGEVLTPPEFAGEALSSENRAADVTIPDYDNELHCAYQASGVMKDAFISAVDEPDNKEAWESLQAKREEYEGYRRLWTRQSREARYAEENSYEGFAVQAAWRLSRALKGFAEWAADEQKASYIWPDVLGIGERLTKAIEGEPDTPESIDSAGWMLNNHAQRSYDLLMESAVHVGGSHSETPLIWQEVHNGYVGGGIASNYVIARKPEGGNLTVTREFEIPEAHDPRGWHFRDTTPTVDESGYTWVTTVRYQRLTSRYGYNVERILYSPFPNGSCVYLGDGGTPEILEIDTALEDARRMAPIRQMDFLSMMSPDTE